MQVNSYFDIEDMLVLTLCRDRVTGKICCTYTSKDNDLYLLRLDGDLISSRNGIALFDTIQEAEQFALNNRYLVKSVK